MESEIDKNNRELIHKLRQEIHNLKKDLFDIKRYSVKRVKGRREIHYAEYLMHALKSTEEQYALTQELYYRTKNRLDEELEKRQYIFSPDTLRNIEIVYDPDNKLPESLPKDYKFYVKSFEE